MVSGASRVPHFGPSRSAGKFQTFPPAQHFSSGVVHSTSSSMSESTSKQKLTSSLYPHSCPKHVIVIPPSMRAIVSESPLPVVHVTMVSGASRVPHFGPSRSAGKFQTFPPAQHFSSGVVHSTSSSMSESTSKQKLTSSLYPHSCPKHVIEIFPLLSPPSLF